MEEKEQSDGAGAGFFGRFGEWIFCHFLQDKKFSGTSEMLSVEKGGGGEGFACTMAYIPACGYEDTHETI